MVYFSLKDNEKILLKNIIGKKLISIKHDPLDKFGRETVYGRIFLIFEDLIILINYDYAPFELFGSSDDDRPCFSIKSVCNETVISALENTSLINVNYNCKINDVILIEDKSNVKWENKTDETLILTALILKFDNFDLAIEGDFMIPLLDVIRCSNAIENLSSPGCEYENDPSTSFKTQRIITKL